MYRHSTSSCPTMTEEISIDLFPVPIQSPRSSRQNNPLIPRTWPGVSPLSTTALQSILSDNHKRWHIFLNDRQFHKYDLSLILWCLSKLLYKSHSAHIVLTLWRLGADKSLLESAYKRNCESQKAAFASPNSIDQQNWRDFVGDER